MKITVTKCPNCGTEAINAPYDIGDGPELNCHACDWCWGAEGQPLSNQTQASLAAARALLPPDHWMNQDIPTKRLI